MERSEILSSIARTLFVTSFADACDDEEYPFDGGDQKAGGGEDWFNTVTDPTPESAEIEAQTIVEDFESRNKRLVEDAAIEWVDLGGQRHPGAEGFGHCLAMVYLGTGVGLWDDISEPIDSSFETGDTDYGYFNW